MISDVLEQSSQPPASAPYIGHCPQCTPVCVGGSVQTAACCLIYVSEAAHVPHLHTITIRLIDHGNGCRSNAGGVAAVLFRSLPFSHSSTIESEDTLNEDTMPE